MKQFASGLLLLACFAICAEATNQDLEVLLYAGRSHPTPIFPLETCPNFNEDDLLHLEGGGFSSANFRGYVGTWEIAENKLWLIDIETWIRAGTENTQTFSYQSLKRATLDDLFPGKVVDGRVHAAWFTGRIFSPGYRYAPPLSDEARKQQEAEARLIIDVSNGVVQKIEVCDVPILPDSPVIACYGDSITAGTHLVADERYPAVLQSLLPDAAVLNHGIGGNTSSQGLARLEKAMAEYESAIATEYSVDGRELTQSEREALRRHPDLVVLLFGTNDSVLTAAGKYRVPVEKYCENLREMVLRCRKNDTEAILCTLLPIIPEPYYTRHPREFYDAEGGLEKILLRYRTAAKEVGKELDVPVVDLYEVFEKDLTLLRPAPDGVHPNARGAKAIAREIAKLLSAERKPVRQP